MLRSVGLVLLAAGALFVKTALADTFESDGVEIYYSVHGAGEPVVLIHGYTMTGATNFGDVGTIDRLAQSYRVIAIDARGHGASGKPQDPAAYGGQMVRDVINLLDHLDISRAHVAGYSMGGMIVQKLATDYPERVIRAVIGGAGWNDQTDFSFSEVLAAGIESGNGLTPLIVALTPEGQAVPSAEEIDAINTMLFANNDAAALAAVARGFPELMELAEPKLRQNDVPLLYLIGALDPIMEAVDHAKTAANNAEFVVIPGVDHMTAIAHPMFAESIVTFLGAE